MKSSISSIVIVLVLTLVSNYAHALNLSVTVKFEDENGDLKPLEGANVVLTSSDSTRTKASDSSGLAIFSGINSGDVVIRVSYQGIEFDRLETRLSEDLELDFRWRFNLGDQAKLLKEAANEIVATATNAALVPENVVWQNPIGVRVTGNTLVKGVETAWGNAGASSTKAIHSGDGYMEFTVSENSTHKKMAGFSHVDKDQDYASIDFAIHPTTSGQLKIFEKGVAVANVGTYVAEDVFRITVNSGVVRYFKNGNLIFTSDKTPVYPLVVDTSLYSQYSTIANVKVAAVNRLVPANTVVSGGPNGVGDGANYHRASYCPSGKTILSGNCNCGSFQVTLNYASNNSTWYCGCSGAAPVGQIVSTAICTP